MLTRLRTTGVAWAGTLIIVLAMSGVAFGSVVLTADEAPTDESAQVDTTATFEDLDGNGVDDDCQTGEIVEDAEAAAAAQAAIDLDGDGTISVSEAAQSDRTGGKNCNHGGYVSQVAQDQCDEGTTEGTEETEESTEGTEESTEESTEDTDAAAECEAAEETEDETAEQTPCEEVAAPVYDPEAYSGPGGFGRYVSEVAQSDAVGGKNCNHGGAVSEAVKAAKEQAQAEREAAKAERKAEREAAKAARQAERAAAKAERRAGRGGGD